MYVPAHFAESDPDFATRLIRDNGFALLVSTGPAGPVATHLPMTYHPEQGVLRCHVARANPHWHGLEQAGPVLAIFSGPHGYVSPRWFQPGDSVPSWNYEAVHVYGTASLIEGEAVLQPILAALAAQYDPTWPMGALSADYFTRLTRAIVGIEIAVTRIETKRKLSQNRPPADIAGVIAALEASGREMDRALAEAMRQASADSLGSLSA